MGAAAGVNEGPGRVEKEWAHKAQPSKNPFTSVSHTGLEPAPTSPWQPRRPSESISTFFEVQSQYLNRALASTQTHATHKTPRRERESCVILLRVHSFVNGFSSVSKKI
jgi:LmbE family N-acetylglucosaminyl deacetylase